MNVWILSNLTDGLLGQFAKRSLSGLEGAAGDYGFEKRQWPADEATVEEERVDAANQALLPLVYVIEDLFNTTLNESIYATWPNPFLNASVEMTNQENLLFVDGSEIFQEIPIWPIVQPIRRPDFIIANDAGGTELSNGWMNGSSLIDTAAYCAANGVPFPKVPDQQTFLNLNLTLYPTFFGCNDSVDVPLVLYAADAPWSAYTNETLLNGVYDPTQLDAILNNTFNLYTYGNNTVDTDWSICLACGFMLRSLQRANMTVPDFCNTCWDRHCWNGTYNSTMPSEFFQPGLVLNSSLTYAEFQASPEGNNIPADFASTNTTNAMESGNRTGSASSDEADTSGSTSGAERTVQLNSMVVIALVWFVGVFWLA
jgi:lysophospholipase